MIYLTPIGLGFDIVGFTVVVLYGHAIFMRQGSRPPTPDEGKDGDFYMHVLGGDTSVDTQYRRLLVKAWVGVVMVVFGFILQMIGSIAVILESSI